MVYLDLSYVVANVLFHMKQLKINDLEQICLKIMEKGYVIDYSYENVYKMSNEWKDFFRLDRDILTLVSKDILFETIFIDVLSDNIKQDIFNSMLYQNKQKNNIRLLK